MWKKIILTSFIITLIFNASAQFVNLGQEKFSTKWNKIKTDQFSIIFPNYYKTQAIKAAKIYTDLYSHSLSKGENPGFMKMIMYAGESTSNGNAGWAPKKSELYMAAPQTPTDYWLKNLCVHEFRHVVQYSLTNKSWTKGFATIFGQMFPMFIVGAYYPMWFVEGDATVFETSYNNLGRGRSPEFLNELKAQMVEKGMYSMDKAVLGSDRDHIANRYALGYYMVSETGIRYGSDIWAKAINRTAKRPWGLTPFNTSLRRSIKGSKYAEKYFNPKKALYYENFETLLPQWRYQADSITRNNGYITDIKTSDKFYTNYHTPQEIDKTTTQILQQKYKLGTNNIIFLREGMDNHGEICIISQNGNGDEATIPLVKVGNLPDNHIVCKNGIIAWSENKLNTRWEHNGKNVIITYDIKTGKHKCHKGDKNRYSPFYTDYGWGCIENDNNGTSYISLYNDDFSVLTSQIKAREDELFIHPTFAANAIYTVVQSPNGNRIEKIDTRSGHRTPLTQYFFYEIDNPQLNNGNIIFRASFNANNALYELNTNNGDITLIAETAYGLRYPSWGQDGKTIYASKYTSDGYKPISFKYNKIHKVTFKNFPSADKLSAQDTHTQDTTTYEITPYRKALNMFNIHSWGPLAINTYENETDIALCVYSQNILGTLSFIGGYKFTSINDDIDKWFISGTYSGLRPIFDFKAESGRTSYYMDALANNKTTGMLDTITLNIKGQKYNLEVVGRLPFRFNNLNRTSLLQPYIKFSTAGYTKGEIHSIYKIHNGYIGTLADKENYATSNLKAPNYKALEYAISYSTQTLYAQAQIAPAYASYYRIGYSHAVGNDSYLGNRKWIETSQTIPGFLTTHSASLYIGYEQQSKKQAYFGNNIRDARGLDLRRGYKLASGSLTYSAPIWYPEINLGPILYIKTVKATIFIDAAYEKMQYLKSTLNKSFGAEIKLESNALRLTIPITLGIRTGYETRTQSLFCNFLFSYQFSI